MTSANYEVFRFWVKVVSVVWLKGASRHQANKDFGFAVWIFAKHPIAYFFFFPALPDKCETWSVTNWKLCKNEIKFLQKKETNKEQNRNKTSTPTHKPKAPGQANQPGKFANYVKQGETKAPLSAPQMFSSTVQYSSTSSNI